MDLYQRPQYHFQPLANWMNDPNGLIQWRGQYHLFYQHNPNGPQWAQMHWGHAVSPDLLHWTHLPIALAPTPGGPDWNGVFSGCAVDHDGVPTLVYTGVDPQVQCIATSDDDLVTWHKYEGNPVIAAPPEGIPPEDFRDPYVWREPDGWYAVIGSSTAEGQGIALLYRSPDLRAWEYVGPLCQGDGDQTGHVWECPNFFALRARHVLITAPIPLGRAIYFSGQYHNHAFTPELTGEIDLGGCLYAPQVMIDQRGRRLLFGWLWEARAPEAQIAAGWAGAMSLPRELSLAPDGRLTYAPAEEVASLRRAHWGARDIALEPDVAWQAPQGGDTIEILARFDLGSASQVGLRVRCADDGSERTLVYWDADEGQLVVDASASARDVPGGQRRQAAFGPDGELELRLFLDRSVIECFANGRCCLTSRIYPDLASLGLQAFAHGGSAHLRTIDIWTMDSIWHAD